MDGNAFEYSEVAPGQDNWKRRKVSSVQPLFMSKAYEMMNNCPPDLGGWSVRGDTIIIRNSVEFAAKIIPTYFRHNNFSSFVRQLNLYGFSKVHATVLAQNAENSYLEYKHPCFLRGRPELLCEIVRKPPFGGISDFYANNSVNNLGDSTPVDVEVAQQEASEDALLLSNPNLTSTSSSLPPGMNPNSNQIHHTHHGHSHPNHPHTNTNPNSNSPINTAKEIADMKITIRKLTDKVNYLNQLVNSVQKQVHKWSKEEGSIDGGNGGVGGSMIHGEGLLSPGEMILGGRHPGLSGTGSHDGVTSHGLLLPVLTSHSHHSHHHHPPVGDMLDSEYVAANELLLSSHHPNNTHPNTHHPANNHPTSANNSSNNNTKPSRPPKKRHLQDA